MRLSLRFSLRFYLSKRKDIEQIHMPKRFTSVIVAAILIMSLVGGSCCPRKDAASNFPKADDKVNILASVSDLASVSESTGPSTVVSESAKLSSVSESTRLSTASGPAQLASEPAQLPVDWKIYTNAQYGYEIRYPSTWYMRENNPNTPGIAVRHILQHTDFSPARDYDNYKSQVFFCSVIVWENHLKLPIEGWLKRENPKHPALLSGKTVTRGNKTIILHEPQGNAYYINAWIANNDRAYQVFFCEPTRERSYAAIFDLMLETLRFTYPSSVSTKVTVRPQRSAKVSLSLWPHTSSETVSGPVRSVVDMAPYITLTCAECGVLVWGIWGIDYAT